VPLSLHAGGGHSSAGSRLFTKKALLGFHAAWSPTDSGGKVLVPSQTRRMLRIYPAALQHWIARNGGLKANMIFLQGKQLNTMVKPCADGEVAALQ